MKKFGYIYRDVAVQCPVCTEIKTEMLYEVSSEEASSHFRVKGQDPVRFNRLKSHIEDLWQGQICQVLQCQVCGLSFAAPFVAGDSQFYALAYDRHGYPSKKWEYGITLRRIRELSNGGKLNHLKLLEIGAGDGGFIRQLSQSIIPANNIVCTEYSDYGAAEIRKLGVNCLPENLLAIDVAKFRSSFSVVCLFQVLEHMDNLEEFFGQLASITRDGARLFIAVPNDKIIEFYETNSMLLDMPPNHVSRWTRKAFDILGRRHGWRLLEHRIESFSFLALYKRCAIYRYLKRRQLEGSLSYRVASIREPKLRRILEIYLVGLNVLALLSLTRKIATERLGNSQWVHLEKIR